jgi:cellulose biosynthesis protein BcsQ
MFLQEVFQPTVKSQYSTEKDDQSVQKLSDTRKSRLTLAQIKRLRIMNDMRKFEHQKEVEGLSKQYRPAAAPGALPGL